jgi:hypothetical protein
MFGEEPDEANDEWKRQQKGKRRIKREEPLNQFSDRSSNFGHCRFPSTIALARPTLSHKIALEGRVHGGFSNCADTRPTNSVLIKAQVAP